MLPARDEQEYSLLPQDDIDFVSGWMNWTDSHISWLRNTKTITGQPSGGKLDATAMVEGSAGAVFVQNPTARQQVLTVTLNASLGFESGCGGAGKLAVRASGSSNRGFKPHDLSVVACGGLLNLTVPPSTALSFEFSPEHQQAFFAIDNSEEDTATTTADHLAVSSSSDVRVFGNGAGKATVDWSSGRVTLTGTEGPAGQSAELTVVLRVPLNHPDLTVGANLTAAAVGGGGIVQEVVIENRGDDEVSSTLGALTLPVVGVETGAEA